MALLWFITAILYVADLVSAIMFNGFAGNAALLPATVAAIAVIGGFGFGIFTICLAVEYGAVLVEWVNDGEE